MTQNLPSTPNRPNLGKEPPVLEFRVPELTPQLREARRFVACRKRRAGFSAGRLAFELLGDTCAAAVDNLARLLDKLDLRL